MNFSAYLYSCWPRLTLLVAFLVLSSCDYCFTVSLRIFQVRKSCLFLYPSVPFVMTAVMMMILHYITAEIRYTYTHAFCSYRSTPRCVKVFGIVTSRYYLQFEIGALLSVAREDDTTCQIASLITQSSHWSVLPAAEAGRNDARSLRLHLRHIIIRHESVEGQTHCRRQLNRQTDWSHIDVTSFRNHLPSASLDSIACDIDHNLHLG